MDKKASRIRRSARTRAKLRELVIHRLSIHRTPMHIYAQIIAPDGSTILASASTLDKSVRSQISGHSGNTEAAKIVGKVIAERAASAGIQRVGFDRSGFKYHGRVKALADAAREQGLQF
jgi:large subunit ribosomal protein L18